MKKILLFLLVIGLVSCKKEFKSSEKEILEFKLSHSDNVFLKEDIYATITNDTINFILPSDTLGTKIKPQITVSTNAVISPESLQEIDLSKPVNYTVRAADGSVKNYVIVSKSKASQKSILSFSFKLQDNAHLPQDIHASLVNDTIKIRIPDNLESSVLKPAIKLSEGSSLLENFDNHDFQHSKTITVVAEDNSLKKYVTATTIVPKPSLSYLKINNADCAYNGETKTFYYPVSPNSTLSTFPVSFDSQLSYKVGFDEITAANNETMNFTLVTNKEVEVFAVDEFDRKEAYKLIITGLPIVQMSTDGVIGDVVVNARMKLVDPEHQIRHTPLLFNSNITVKHRGASSRAYPKKQFAVKTVNESYKKEEKSIMGLRTDNNWILDAMYIDKGKMRNRLCTDIWNSMNKVPHITQEPEALGGTRGYMVEVFINNSYEGIYCLTEKLDRKQLKIKKEYGVSYKGDNWGNAVQFYAASTYNNLQETWDGWEFAYPEIGDEPAPDWEYISEFVKFVSTASDDEFKQKIGEKVYIDNVIDYLIFINAIGAADNTAKNTFFSFYDYRNNSKFFYSVWDLDGTMGRAWNGVKYQETTFAFIGDNNRLFTRLLKTNAENFVPKLKQRWNELKNNQLSKTTITNRVDEYYDQLYNSKAYEREYKRWNSIPSNMENERHWMTYWYGFHQDKLDAYINKL